MLHRSAAFPRARVLKWFDFSLMAERMSKADKEHPQPAFKVFLPNVVSPPLPPEAFFGNRR